MKLYRTAKSVVLEFKDCYYASNTLSLDDLIARDDLRQHLEASLQNWQPADVRTLADLHAPIESQEVWGAGVTYYRSRIARMEESKDGGSFYDRVYDAERPEIFFKATPHRVVGPGAKVAIRQDSRWSVPEPELALVISPQAKIVGYTIANDMSSRDIEGQNPLYLPQAKTYDRSCALGPALLVTSEPMPDSTSIKLEIARAGGTVFTGTTTLAERKRTERELISYLFRHCSFPSGCVLMTGTGIVPADDFTLEPGDEIRISISGIGTLVNTVG
jgi:2-dehydro-3-deoxy-D-arabinonate dehydratase